MFDNNKLKVYSGVAVPNTFYRHYKGGVYEIVVLAMSEADGSAQVVYKNWHGMVFVRPAEEFFAAISSTAVQDPSDVVKRFTLISELDALRDLQAHEARGNIQRSS